MKHAFLSVVLVLGLSACAPIPTKTIPGETNFNYGTGAQQKSTGKNIAMIINNKANRNSAGVASEFDSAFKSTVKEILNKRGFNLTGPYGSSNDMVYAEKKSSFVLAKIVSDVSVGEKTTRQQNCLQKYCTDRGYFYPTGRLAIEFIEPLTGEKIAYKHVELDDLNQKFEYIHEYNNPTAQNDLIMSGLDMLNKSNKKTQLTNSRPKAQADAWNAVYKSSISKLDKHLSREEILSFARDIKELKSLKRF